MFEQIIPSLSAVLSIAGIGAVFGLILSVAKITLRVEKDPRIEKIAEILPGANCGACGLPGCNGYAAGIVNNGLEIDLCPVGGVELIREIAEIMGMNVSVTGVPLKAKVHCHGGNIETMKRFIYEGPRDCRAAHELMRGFKVCEFGCLGLGDCESICPFDAIEMSENGLPVINDLKCTGCGKCIKACPRNIISLVPENFDTYVLCKNTQKAGQMKKGCTVGCIGCKLCEKACKEVHADNPDVETAIRIVDFCAVIDYDVCINCHKCVEVCPVPVINPKNLAKPKQSKKKEKPAVQDEQAGADA